jgi:hypothetical protein
MPYKPGDIVPQSGIYNVVHDPKHHLAHDVTCIAGRKFPPCNGCGDAVEFKLKTAAVHVHDHRSFVRN